MVAAGDFAAEALKALIWGHVPLSLVPMPDPELISFALSVKARLPRLTASKRAGHALAGFPGGVQGAAPVAPVFTSWEASSFDGGGQSQNGEDDGDLHCGDDSIIRLKTDSRIARERSTEVVQVRNAKDSAASTYT
jgi:hypothetical protein